MTRMQPRLEDPESNWLVEPLHRIRMGPERLAATSSGSNVSGILGSDLLHVGQCPREMVAQILLRLDRIAIGDGLHDQPV